MTKRMTRKKAEAASKPSGFEFDFSNFSATPELKTSPPAKKQKQKEINLDTKTSSLTNISDLKAMSSSHLQDITRHLDRSHSQILKDFEASQSRLHKRLKLQTQGCQQVMDEAEKEYKKMSDRIGEGRETMKASYSEFITEVQASSSRVFKASLPELSQSFGKAIGFLKSRYGTV